jgi:F-box-like
MSISSFSQSNILGADVLQIIFQQLNGEDLGNCEVVCRQWRDILFAGTPWRRLFHRKVNYSPSWRKEQKKLEKNQLILRTDQYRDICRNLLQMERNWRIGRLQKSVYSVNANNYQITISDDYVTWDYCMRFDNGKYRSGCSFLDTESMELQEIPLTCGDQHLEEMAIRRADRKSSVIEVCDPKNQWTINVEGEEEDYLNRRLYFGSGRLVECTHPYNLLRGCTGEYIRRIRNGTERIRVWKMGYPPTLIHDRTFEDRNLIICKVDGQFIVATGDEFWTTATGRTVYFFSTETLEVFTSLDVNGSKWDYDRGLLFQYRRNGIVRILNVASKTYFNDVRLPFRKEDKRIARLLWSKWASTNSNVMVIGWKYSNDSSGILSHLSVYDLEAVKKPNSDPGFHLLYTLQFEFNMSSFVMDEKLIAFNGSEGKDDQFVTVLNFANFSFAERKSSDLKENSEADENVKMKVIYDRSYFDDENEEEESDEEDEEEDYCMIQ